MKSRRLPETDIANLAFVPASQKQKSLEAWLKPRQAKGSYDPYRSTSGDAVNRQLPLYPNGQVLTPWDMLEKLVVGKCRGDERLIQMNLPVARSTHEFATKNSLSAEPIDVGSLILAHGHRYDFGASLILRYDNAAAVMFPDLRRTGQLTPHGRQVVYSAMHQRVRVNYPEYERLELEIWRYRNNEDRSIEVFRHTDGALYSYDDLSRDFSETYEIMNRLREGSEVDRRGQSDGNFIPW